ncbi:DUF2914 domain-containing protein [Desulfosoma caldarium]|uniref:DUF2914 family protein n=1 Tax=Desulfosoma caldarium TaxID=610254 RepID=A0A3N1UQ19_9BACT|nr:DUF2914 domain-containing protein [Desulfosoma caldarium]ROQ93235.1 DUF2914 family protein [Desulfosoma caldarium]
MRGGISVDRSVADIIPKKTSPPGQARQRPLLFALARMGLVVSLLFFGLVSAQAQEKSMPASGATAGVELSRAGICEALENLNPVNTASVFSVTQGQIYCFTEFGTVRSQTVIHHRWYHRDALTTQIRLKLYPPRWTTYSVLKLREVDKGPWKVEITDAEGRVLSVLRFSIVD